LRGKLPPRNVLSKGRGLAWNGWLRPEILLERRTDMSVARVTMAAAAALAIALPAAAEAPKEETVKIPGTEVSFSLVHVPGGAFKMGSPETEAGREADEGAVREIALRPFWIGKHEVAWDAYTLYFESWKQAKVDGITRPSQPDVCNPKEPLHSGAQQSEQHPAVSVGWFGAMGYCAWLSVRTGQQYRLPTEAEWECASRAGSADAAPAPLGDHAWFQDNSEEQTHVGGKRKPNALGAADLLGNVWEYCLEPFAPPDSTAAVRGGAWNSPAADVRHANRQRELRAAWLKIDPKRPFRTWWLTDAPFVGLRVVRLADDGASKEDREAAAKQIDVKSLALVNKGQSPYFMARVTGEVTYAGEKPLDELELLVHFVAEDGSPMMTDPRDKPSFSYCQPVLVNSAHAGPQTKPMAKGETRTFELEVPFPYDEVGPVEAEKLGAKVTRIHFAK
jgi:formylglycine-generating enzyme required for sulfatase activity